MPCKSILEFNLFPNAIFKMSSDFHFKFIGKEQGLSVIIFKDLLLSDDKIKFG